MSMVDKFKAELVERILDLSQNQGLHDDEIALQVGYSRATVNRTRLAHDIPTANLSNRKDKKSKCPVCAIDFLIRRKERRNKECPECFAIEQERQWLEKERRRIKKEEAAAAKEAAKLQTE